MEAHIFRNKFIQPELFYELFVHMNCGLNIFAAKPIEIFHYVFNSYVSNMLENEILDWLNQLRISAAL
jgi:hypothetical protein